MELTNRETAIVLAGLRILQGRLQEVPCEFDIMPDLARSRVTAEEIGILCKKVHCE